MDDILNLSDEGDKGYTFEVDLNIPNHLHDTFKDFPLCPDHYIPDINELSNYQKDLINKGIGNIPKDVKLVNSLKEKIKYVIDYRMLKYVIQQGIIVTKIHQVISYDQKPWLKAYIDKNTVLRQKANNDFEKDFFKLMNNSVYGKQMENVRKRCDVKLLSSYKSFQKHKDYDTRTIIDEDHVLLYRKKKTVTLNKPIYGGFVVLELSKLLMYKFYYDVLKPKYRNNMKLLGTDTDSFIIYVETNDIYDDIKENINHFDTCGYLLESIPHANNKIPGKFKDEYLGIPIREFVGLRSKMYAFKTDCIEKKVCKGIRKQNIEKMKFDMYKDTLFNDKETYEDIYNITSKEYTLYTIKTRKIALSPYDDKRYLINNINTLPYGYIAKKCDT